MSDIYIWNFNKTLTNDVVSFEQPGPKLLLLKVYPYTLRHMNF